MDRFARAAPNSPRLQVSLRHRIGRCALDVSFELREPWTILFGPSGSGKTTILRAIAGLLRPKSARMVWALPVGNDAANGFTAALTLVDTAEGVFVPAHRRMIPMAAQVPALFPHLTVRENIFYSVRPGVKGSTGGAVAVDKEAALFRLFHVMHLLEQRADRLSGGEAQRVSLARAAAAAVEGGLLLIDEPFTGLDFALRSEIIRGLRTWAIKRDICVLSVTHDLAEAFELGAEVIQLAEGRVVAQGAGATVLAEERERLLRQIGS